MSEPMDTSEPDLTGFHGRINSSPGRAPASNNADHRVHPVMPGARARPLARVIRARDEPAGHLETRGCPPSVGKGPHGHRYHRALCWPPTLLAFTHGICHEVLTPINLSDDASLTDRPAGRVAMLVKNTFEFDARVEREARALAHEGWDVVVVALHDGANLPLGEERGSIKVTRVPRLYGRFARLGPASTVAPSATQESTGWGGAASALLRGIRRLARLAAPVLRWANTAVVDQRMAVAAARHNPDVVHAHDLNTLGVAARLARHLGVRVVYDSHELHTHRAGDPWHTRIANRLRERRLIHAADRVITSTAAYADHMAHRYRIPPPTVIRNVPETATPNAPLDLHGKLGLDGSRRLMLYEGSVQPHRGLEQAIGALTLLPEWDLVVIGYGPHRPSLERAATRHGVRGRVHFTGAVDHSELLRWTAGADVGLCLIQDAGLSYRWSLPNKLFEYLHAGIPVVASEFGEMGQLVQRTGIGATADPANSTAIAEAVRQAAATPQELLDKSAADYTWAKEALGLVDVYSALPVRANASHPKDSATRPVVLFVASNGIGAGHLTRVAAVARRLQPPLQPVVATMSDAVGMLEADGIPYEHIPSRPRTGLDVRSWNGYLRERLRPLIHSLRPVALVFDGTWPYEGLLEASMADTSLSMVWMRRGMWKHATGTAALGKADWFELVIEPGDLAAAADEGPTAHAQDALHVGPVVYLEPHETLGREEARRALDLPLDTPCALLTLGAGDMNQLKPPVHAAAAELAQQGFAVCATDPAVATSGQDGHQLRTVRIHALSRYLKAFDCVVSAAGYNTFHELLGNCIPTLFVPNEHTAADDQSARAAWAATAGVALVCQPDPDEMRRQARSLASAKVQARLAAACAGLSPLDGSHQAAAELTRRYASARHRTPSNPHPPATQRLRRHPSVRRFLSLTYPPRWRERHIDETLTGREASVLLWCVDWPPDELERLVDTALPQLSSTLTWIILTSTPAHLSHHAPNIHFEHVLCQSDWSNITAAGAVYRSYLEARLNAIRTTASAEALIAPPAGITASDLQQKLRARGLASTSSSNPATVEHRQHAS